MSVTLTGIAKLNNNRRIHVADREIAKSHVEGANAPAHLVIVPPAVLSSFVPRNSSFLVDDFVLQNGQGHLEVYERFLCLLSEHGELQDIKILPGVADKIALAIYERGEIIVDGVDNPKWIAALDALDDQSEALEGSEHIKRSYFLGIDVHGAEKKLYGVLSKGTNGSLILNIYRNDHQLRSNFYDSYFLPDHVLLHHEVENYRKKFGICASSQIVVVEPKSYGIFGIKKILSQFVRGDYGTFFVFVAMISGISFFLL